MPLVPRALMPGVILAGMLLVVPCGHAAAAEQPVQANAGWPIPAPVDRNHDGVVDLVVDATDVARKVFNVRVRIPVQEAGRVTLLYPRWESASHGPSLTVTNLAGLVVSVDGRRVQWRRDPIEPHAFHLEVPAGATTIEATYQVVAGEDLLAPDMVVVPWQKLVLYPAGWYARNIQVRPSVSLPPGLAPASSLEAVSSTAGALELGVVTLESLLDSPLLAARHLGRIPLGKAGGSEVTLNLMAPRQEDLEVSRERVADLRRMVAQAAAVFGPAPFERYEILARMSDDGATGGTEHRRSGEIAIASSYFREWPAQLGSRDIIPHELVHAWNGLYRVPADLWAPTPNTPQSGSLLWVYEGQSEFWGRVLAARAGLRSRGETLDQLAIDAARVANTPGRAWRSLSDDVNYPSFMLLQRVRWTEWQRRKDYYQEGVMLWLHVDARLRALTRGRKGIDDFARSFFAGATPDAPARTYTFAQLCDALEATAPGDWARHLRAWVDGHDEVDTNAGLAGHGWQLVYTDTPTEAFRQQEEEAGMVDLSYSLGMGVTAQGVLASVVWDGPAFKAGLAPRARIVEVRGQPFDFARLLDAVRDAGNQPVELLVEQDGKRVAMVIPYSGSLRYPRLARIPGTPDTLSRLLAPR